MESTLLSLQPLALVDPHSHHLSGNEAQGGNRQFELLGGGGVAAGATPGSSQRLLG